MAKIVKMNPGQRSSDDLRRIFIEKFDFSRMTPEDKKLMKMLGVESAEDLLNLLGSFSMENTLFQLIASGKTEDDIMVEDFFPDDGYFEDDEDDNEKYYVGDDDCDLSFPPPIPEGLFLPDCKVQEYHIRIKLNNTSVKIWRELKVPSNMSMELLAYVLLSAMGWENEHYHDFTCRNGRDVIFYKSDRDLKANDGFLMQCNRRTYNSDKTPLSKVLGEKGKRILFEYDFGDCWQHDVWTKEIRDYEPGEEPKVTLLKGQGQCPPEDCGGVWGYEELLELMKKKRKTQDDKEELEWYFTDYKTYDPGEFDLEKHASSVESLMDDVEEEIGRRKNKSKK